MQVRRSHRWAKGEGIRVAVIDTGMDLTHPELDGKIATSLLVFVATGFLHVNGQAVSVSAR